MSDLMDEAEDYVLEKAEEMRQWGRWGEDDELGTLNHVTPEKIVEAAQLIQDGKVISLAMNFDQQGPQTGEQRRYNPLHFMTATGTDASAGVYDDFGIRYTDDIVSMPLQCGTQWDALSHIVYGDKMWNGYSANQVDAMGAHKLGIENTSDQMVGRGVLLDVARYKETEALDEGYGITCEDLENCAEEQDVEVKQGDFVLVRTGQIEKCFDEGWSGEWGEYAGGEAPGVAFETVDWVDEHEVAAVATDTWGAEVIPNETDVVFQPWHWVVIPNMGLTIGEMFRLDELAEDCAGDGRNAFFFVAPPLPITGAVGSPLNPLAIK